MPLSHQDFPALELFLSAYLHQDWQDEYTSTEAAFRDYLTCEPALTNTISEELKTVMSLEESEVAIDQLLRDAGSYYLPSLHRLPARPWLAGLLDLCPTT